MRAARRAGRGGDPRRLAEQTGLAVDRVDDCNRVLERCGLLEIERHRTANGGRYLPSVYAVREAPNGSDCSSDDRLSPPPSAVVAEAGEQTRGNWAPGSPPKAVAWRGTHDCSSDSVDDPAGRPLPTRQSRPTTMGSICDEPGPGVLTLQVRVVRSPASAASERRHARGERRWPVHARSVRRDSDGRVPTGGSVGGGSSESGLTARRWIAPSLPRLTIVPCQARSG